MTEKQNALEAVRIATDSYRHAREAWEVEQDYMVKKFKQARSLGATLTEIAEATASNDYPPFVHQYISQRLRDRA